MTISIHCQTKFEDYSFFEEKMNEVLNENPSITSCVTGRSKSTEYAMMFFKDSHISCTQQKPKHYKIQNLYNIAENADLSIFFYREDVKIGANLTGKTISRTNNLFNGGTLKRKPLIYKYSL